MLNMEKLLEILSKGEEFTCEYGTGRIETYSIDKDCMSGYNSGGGYKHISLDDPDFDISELRSISVVNEVWNHGHECETCVPVKLTAFDDQEPEHVLNGDVMYKTRMSPRGEVLVYQYNKASKPVITCEIVGKWYDLFVVATDGTVTPLRDAKNSFDDWIDNCPRPDELVEYAEVNDMYVDEQSLEMIVGRIIIEKDAYQFENRFESDNLISYNSRR
jgi:hypothetical protein